MYYLVVLRKNLKLNDILYWFLILFDDDYLKLKKKIDIIYNDRF